MPSAFRRITTSLISVAVILCCSCEKHRVGEYPEVQREKVDEHRAEAPSSKEHAATPSVTPTPAEFFPTPTPH